jgi:hypothetical protein
MNTGMELGPTVGLAALMAVTALPADPVQGYAWAFGTAAIVFALAAALAVLLVSRPAADGARGCRPAQARQAGPA